MRYKWLAEDFVVEEVIDHPLSSHRDRYKVFVVEKKNVETFQFLQSLAKKLRIRSSDIGIAGIKDTRALAKQWMSVPASVGMMPVMQGVNFSFLGYSSEEVSLRSLRENRFVLTVREIEEEEKQEVEDRLLHIMKEGYPNYFDDQRFGSYVDGKWVGKLIFQGKMEEALYLLMKLRFSEAFFRYVEQHWGDWKECLELARKRHHREGMRVFGFLSKEGHEKGFRHAVGLFDHRYLILVVNAYRGYLFNRYLSRQCEGGEGVFLPTCAGDVFFPVRKPILPEEGWLLAYDGEGRKRGYEEILQEEGLALKDMKVRGIYGVVVHASPRPLWVMPVLESYSWGKDEVFVEKNKLLMSFRLPPGSYATWVLKWLAYGKEKKKRTT